MSLHSRDLQRLLAEGPFVRALAHQLLADEPDDVVQQVFVKALQDHRLTLVRPRSWLARVVRNLVTDQRRRLDRRNARERAAAVAERLPSAAELVAVEESHRTLVDAVNRLPHQLRAVVLLRYFEDLPPRRIATVLDLPVTAVREQLRTALQQLRSRLDADHNCDRRAWLLPLVPVALQPRTLPWRELLQAAAAPTLSTGVLAMKTKTMIGAAMTVLVLAALWALWPGDAPRTESPSGSAPARLLVVNPDPTRPDAHAAPTGTAERELAAPPRPGTTLTGSLVVVVRYADEPQQASGLSVILNRPGLDYRVNVIRGRTDDTGTARFDVVPAGNWEVSTGRAQSPKDVEIRAGECTEFDLRLSRGMAVSGLVVDGAGVPVAGAQIEVARPWYRDPEIMTTTGADGTFALRACPRESLIGARAAGYSSSSLKSVASHDGTPREVRLELVAPGGVVEGQVVAGDGAPLAGAVVRVGKGTTDSLVNFVQGGAALPAQVRTDAEGRFRAIGVPVGPQPVQAQAVGFAAWRGSCEVRANLTVPIRVIMSAGATCVGKVTNEDGTPVADATVQLGNKGDFVQLSTRTAADGRFTMHDLPVGEVDLTATDSKKRTAKARITTATDAEVHCELQLSEVLELRGRVVDESGQPLADLDVDATAEGPGEPWFTSYRTDKDGRFHLGLCPKGRRLTVLVSGGAFDPVRRTGVDPGAGELHVQVQRPLPSARILGLVLDADGKPAARIAVDATRDPTRSGSAFAATRADGHFEIGPLRTGRWRLRIAEDGYAWYRSPTFTLAENATLDLGRIQLHRGGILLARVEGAEPNQLEYAVWDDRGEFVNGMLSTILPLRSLPLNPGGYRLYVTGKGFAPQRLPFTIRDGAETELKVVAASGTKQRFEFQLGSAGDATDRITFDVRRGDEVVLSTWAFSREGLAVERWLAPGEYSLAVTNEGLHGSAQFIIGSEPGPAVIVQVR